MNRLFRLFSVSLVTFTILSSAPALAGLADIFVEIYDGVKSGAIEPTYQTLKEYIVEKKLLEFLGEIDLGDKELEAKYRALIQSNEFDETYFPFFMSMLERVGVLQKMLKKSSAEGSNQAPSVSFLQDPQKKEYLRTVLIVFGKLFLYKNGEDVAAEALREQIVKLAQNQSLPEFVTSRLKKILEDPEKAMDLYHFIGVLVKSVASDYLTDFLERDKLRQAKLQWLDKAGLEKVTQYFKESLTKRRAVMILVDGVGGEYLEDLLSESDSYTTLQKLHDESAWVKRSLSSTPTISTRNIAILETGVTVSDPEFKGEVSSTGIPNFTYVDRKKQEWMYFWGRDQFDTAADDRFSYFMGEVMLQVKPDLAEALGLANLRTRSQKEQYLNHLRTKLVRYLKRSQEKWANRLLWTERHYYDIAREILQTEDEGLPDFLLWYNPWVDHKTHEFGTHSQEVLGKHLPKFDQDVGEILSFYQAAGLFDHTLFGMVSDHGQVNVELPKGSVNVEDLVISPLTSNWKKISSDEGGPPKIDRVKSSIVGYDVVFGSTAGGSFVMDLFHRDAYNEDGSVKDAKRWEDHPRYSEIRNYELMNGERVDWISKIKQELKETLDYALVRDELPKEDPSIDQVVRVISGAGEARVLRKFVSSIWEKLSANPQ
ncbi:MAG: alkaline phosphatase family protein, partial [Deltaproteobacteria bacterium]|nr:alkaline phosphatase family protein [Deltaproteobacteria bacterium]